MVVSFARLGGRICTLIGCTTTAKWFTWGRMAHMALPYAKMASCQAGIVLFGQWGRPDAYDMHWSDWYIWVGHLYVSPSVIRGHRMFLSAIFLSAT